MDYQGIPFRCSICRDTSHLRRNYTSFSKVSSSPDFSSPPAKSVTNKVCTPVSPFPSIEQLKNVCSLFDDATDQDLAYLDYVGSKRNTLAVNGAHKTLVFSSPADESPQPSPVVPLIEIPPYFLLNSSPSYLEADKIHPPQCLVEESFTIPQPNFVILFP